MSVREIGGRPSAMGSKADEVIVPIELNDKLVKVEEEFILENATPSRSEAWKARLGDQGTRSFNAANITAADEEVGKSTPEKGFRDALVRVLSSRLMNPVRTLQLFMAKSDEYPRFVWQDLLLSFGRERDAKETFGPFAFEKFSYLVNSFPDVFQRELVRDSFHLEVHANANHPVDRYGALHAAVLCGRSELVHLLRGRIKSRPKIFEALVPNESDDVSDSFHFLRRALLWRHMEKMTIPYGKVATFMREIEKARKATELDALGKLIDKVTVQQIEQADDAYDPWIVTLAWSSVTKDRGHILEEFKKRKPDIFEQIVRNLKARKSAFTHFLTDPPEETGNMVRVPDDRQVGVTRTVQDLVAILVLQKRKNAGDAVPLNREHSTISPIQMFFLDRFCERTPDNRWTPLHLAASRGDQNMVNALTNSWDVLIEKLGEELKKVYTRKLEETFYDAKYMTPLHYAVLGNHKEIVKFLLNWKMFTPHVNECDIFLRTPFQIACSKQERASIAHELIKNQRVDVNTKDCCAFTSLHWAVHSGSTETVKHVIFDDRKKQTIRTIEKDTEGQNPYEMAARGKEHSHKDIQQLLLYHPAVKDQVERWYRDRQVYVDASNAILVGAALIASVTFGGWLQPPSGNNFWDVRIFWGFNSLSFFFSIATVTSGAAAMLPVGDEYIQDAVESIRRWLVVTSCLLILSLSCVLGAFAAAGFASLSKIPNWRSSDNNNMTITTSVGGFICGIIGLLFTTRLWRVRPDWLNKNVKENLAGFNKQEIRTGIRRKVDSLIYLPVKVSHRIRVKVQPPFASEEEITYGPENFPILKALPDMITKATQNPLFRTLSFSAGVQESLLPIEVDRDRVRELWEELHPTDDSKVNCPIRTYYKKLENLCLYDILHLNGLDKDNSLREYTQMWKDLSQNYLKASSLKEQLLSKSKHMPNDS